MLRAFGPWLLPQLYSELTPKTQNFWSGVFSLQCFCVKGSPIHLPAQCFQDCGIGNLSLDAGSMTPFNTSQVGGADRGGIIAGNLAAGRAQYIQYMKAC